MWLHHLGVINDADVFPVMVEVFMAVAAVMCLLGAGICRLAGTDGAATAAPNKETFPMWERPQILLIESWPPPPVSMRRLRRRSLYPS